ncbi:hypothetical protein MLD38_028191 [Melastoma candidum]|uniref:Uncharacterized protein n=1 Tax=Melastoma candidum TaxID=119954 RepID=A0ACB9N4J3_9MYRT|nr:hypothetical protein MLD38_028191 [Melastoma candidum]
MDGTPSLIHLCVESAAKGLLLRDDYLLPQVFDLPSELFDSLLPRLQPLALQKLFDGLHKYRPYGHEDDDYDGSLGTGSKRKRNENFNLAWKSLFQLRWPDLVGEMKVDDWQQTYWELHLQNCLDEAAEKAVLPSFNGRIGHITISDAILKCIGFDGQAHSYLLQLDQHCWQFGLYVRSLRLQNVFCVGETRDLLRSCRLESLNFSWIRSKEQVDALCELIKQHHDTLRSLKFNHCKLTSSLIDSICGSLHMPRLQSHRIRSFSITASIFLDNPKASFPVGFLSFIVSGRYLDSLNLCDMRLDWNHGKVLFSSLLEAASDVAVLDLSDNNISGWLSNFDVASLNSGKCLQSLRVLNLRGNNLRKEDIYDLSQAMIYMPTLQKLDLSDNPIGDDGIRYLIPLLIKASEGVTPLDELNLGNCDLSSCGVVEFLKNLISSKVPLKALCISDNSLGSQIAPTLAEFLSTTIEILDFGGVGLGPSGFDELLRITSASPKLTVVKIDMSKNRGGLQSAKFLSKLIEVAPCLVNVNAAYNLMPPESLAVIHSALKDVRGNLKLLNLAGNNWEEKTANSALLDLQYGEHPLVVFDGMAGLDAPYDDDP